MTRGAAGGPTSSRRPSQRASERRPVGRPSKLGPDVTDRLHEALSKGNFRKVAAVYAGISVPTFDRWMADQRPEFRAFRALVEQAEAEAEVAVVGNLVELSKRDHRAGIAWLERRAAERWRLDEPGDDATEAVAQEPGRGFKEKTITIPAEMMDIFGEALGYVERTGEVPPWVKRHEEELDEWAADFDETADD
jgi:hypothetical protein